MISAGTVRVTLKNIGEDIPVKSDLEGVRQRVADLRRDLDDTLKAKSSFMIMSYLKTGSARLIFFGCVQDENSANMSIVASRKIEEHMPRALFEVRSKITASHMI